MHKLYGYIRVKDIDKIIDMLRNHKLEETKFLECHIRERDEKQAWIDRQEKLIKDVNEQIETLKNLKKAIKLGV